MQRLAALLLGLSLTLAAFAGDSVDYHDGRLSVSFHQRALAAALSEIGTAAGVRFSLQPGVNGRISTQFSGLPLATAIRRLLNGYNFILLYGDDAHGVRRPMRVLVLAAAQQSRSAKAAVSAGLADSAPRQITLRRSGDGPFTSAGRINGEPVQLLVDTGATTVALSATLAEQLRLDRGRERRIDTASGRTTGYETILDSLQLGPLTLHRVHAVILPAMALTDKVLLGLNALSGLELHQRGNTLTIRQPAGNSHESQ